MSTSIAAVRERGHLFANFELGPEIGSGTTSVVYRAERAGEFFALKVMKKVASSREVEAALQFRNEAAVIARLAHPGLVRVVEVGEFEDQVYVAMELIQGRSLSDLILAGELAEEQVVAIVIRIADALAYVHRNGFVHRDIKPENILVCGASDVKLIDFGFALNHEDEGAKSNGLIGTFLYSPPEQNGMLNRPVDARSDLYALGCVVYECLTGKTVYAAETLVDLMRKHASAPVPDVRELSPATRPVLARVVGKLLAKEPDDRYQSADGLIDDLKALPELELAERSGKLALDARRGRIRLTHDVPLIGRESEVSRLRDSWAGVAEGRGCVLQIEGEGGMGKTRLTQELLNVALARNTLVIRGKCQQHEVVPFGVIREAIDEYILRVSRLAEEERIRQVDAINDAAGDLAPVIRRLSRGLERTLRNQDEAAIMDPNSEQARFFDGICGFLLELARRSGSLLLLIDDTQWIDSSSIEVLKRLAVEIGRQPVMLLATARNDEASRAANERFSSELGEGVLERLVLSPLGTEGVDEFIRAFLGGRGMERELVEKLAAVTKGNVFAIGEYIRAMLNSGTLTPKADGWEVDIGRFSQLTLSTNVLQLILGRIQRLSKETLDVLSTAAICGTHFAREVLCLGLKEKDSTVSRALDEALRASLVERSDETRFAFVHDRVREALVERLSEEQVRDRNQAVADVLADVLDDSPAQVFALARYFINGHPERNLDRAYRACLRAGRISLDAYANENAYQLLRHATALGQKILASGGRVNEDIELDESLGQACLRIGKLAEAHEHFSRCLRLARNAGDVARMHLMICITYNNEGNPGAGWVSLEKCLQTIGRPVPKSLAMVVIGLAWFAFWGVVLDRVGIGYGAARRRDWELRRVISQIMPVASQITTVLGRMDLTTYFAAREYVTSFFMGASPERARSLSYVAYVIGALHVYAFRTRFSALKVSNRMKWRLIDYYTERGFVIASQSGDLAMIGFCTYGKAISNLMGGRLALAEKWALEALPLLKKYSGYNLPTVNIYFLTLNYSWRGYSREVADLVSTEAETLQMSDNVNNQGICFGNAFVQLSLMGRHAEAFAMKEKWSRIVGSSKDTHFMQAFQWCQLLWVLLDQRDLDKEAEEYITLYRNQKAHYSFLPVFDILIGYVRFHQMVRAEGERRQALRTELARAIRDIEYYQGYAVFLCHSHVLRSALMLEEGKANEALVLLDKAQEMAVEVDSKWGIFEIACQKARVARQMGDEITMGAMALAAFELANAHSWRNRANDLRREFALSERYKTLSLGRTDMAGAAGAAPSALPSGATETRSASVGVEASFHNIRAESYIEALMRVSLASAASLDPKMQARSALDELVKILNAERAFLFLARDGADRGGLELEAGRDQSGADLAELGGYSSTVVRKVRETRQPLIVSGTDEGEVLGSQSAVVHNLRSIIAAPLLIKEKLLGVIYLDSRMAKGIFTDREVGILSAISTHIAIALEMTQMARIDAERRELQKDLALTAAVQSFFLPEKVSHRVGKLSLRGFYRACSQASGDWWWYSDQSGTTLDILVGDVTGHGPAAAMLTAATASVLMSLWKRDSKVRLDDLLGAVNDEFTQFSKGQYGMTMSAVSVDHSTSTLRWWNAASPPIIVLNANGELTAYTTRGTPFGSRELSLGYKEAQLFPGDRLFIFTDGLLELNLPNGTLLRTKGVYKLLKETRTLELDAAVEQINREVDRLKMDVPLEDDITYVLMDVQ